MSEAPSRTIASTHDPTFKALVYEHACEGMYGDPAYGGNHDAVGWRFIRFEGDVQPRGYTAVEVTNPRCPDAH